MKCGSIGTLLHLSGSSLVAAETVRGQSEPRQPQLGAFASVDLPRGEGERTVRRKRQRRKKGAGKAPGDGKPVKMATSYKSPEMSANLSYPTLAKPGEPAQAKMAKSYKSSEMSADLSYQTLSKSAEPAQAKMAKSFKSSEMSADLSYPTLAKSGEHAKAKMAKSFRSKKKGHKMTGRMGGPGKAKKMEAKSAEAKSAEAKSAKAKSKATVPPSEMSTDYSHSKSKSTSSSSEMLAPTSAKSSKHPVKAKMAKSAKRAKSMMTMHPSTSPSPSTSAPADQALAQEVTFAPTPYTPPNVGFFDSFEKATFPDGDLEWSVRTTKRSARRATDGRAAHTGTFRDALHEGSRPDGRRPGTRSGEEASSPSSHHWALSQEEAKTGVYSIATPDLNSDDKTPRSAYVDLHVPERWGEGYLFFHLLWDLNFPSSDLMWYVDGEFYDWAPSDWTSDWREFKVYLDGESRMVTWEYIYNPENREDPGEAMVVYMDDVYFAHATDYPTFSPTMQPTLSPTSTDTPISLTLSPTFDTATLPPATVDQSATTAPATPTPTYFPSYFPTNSPTVSAGPTITNTFNLTSFPTYPPTNEGNSTD